MLSSLGLFPVDKQLARNTHVLGRVLFDYDNDYFSWEPVGFCGSICHFPDKFSLLVNLFDGRPFDRDGRHFVSFLCFASNGVNLKPVY